MGWHLSELIAKYGVPGAQIAVLAGGEITQAQSAPLVRFTALDQVGQLLKDEVVRIERRRAAVPYRPAAQQDLEEPEPPQRLVVQHRNLEAARRTEYAH